VQQSALKLIIVSSSAAIKFVMVREMPNKINLPCISKAFIEAAFGPRQLEVLNCF